MPTFIQLAGWSALANAVLNIAGLVALILFFVLGGFWGPVNDVLSVLWALTYLPILAGLYLLTRPTNPMLSLAALVVGVGAALGFALLQSLLVAGQLSFEQSVIMVTTVGGVLGLAVLADGLLARVGALLPAGLSWLMVAYGVGFIVAAAGFRAGGWENPLSALGYLVGVIAGLGWTIWLGRLWLAA